MGACLSDRNSNSNKNNPDLEDYIKKFDCNNQDIGIGVLCKITLKNSKSLPVLILHNQWLKKADKSPESQMILKTRKEPFFEIPIDNFENIYNDEKSNISIIELKEEMILNSQKFLEIDEKPEEYSDKKYCLAYFNNNKLIESTIKFRGINKNSFEYCPNSLDIQNGCPILVTKENKYRLLGMHIKKKRDNNLYESIIIKNSIDKYLKEHPYDNAIKIIEFNNIKDSIITNEIIMEYKIDDNEETIKIFGDGFVANNKKFCKIIIDGKEKKLCSEINKKLNNNSTIQIRLTEINKIINYESMFAWCSTLISISSLKFDTYKATSMKNIFLGCEALKSLPKDISEWDLGYAKDISGMFSSCSSLKSIPNISNWKTENITDVSSLFSGCSSLISLPDISKWETSKVTNMNNLFSKCSSLKSLPDISKWDVKNVSNMNNLFSECSSLETLPNISNWNIQNVFNITRMFYNCQSLTSLPDISKWNISKLEHINSLFEGCSSLKELPDLSKWNTYNIKSLFSVFSGCSSLLSLPDISKWNTTRVTDMNSLFCGCSSLKKLPNISKWNTVNVTDMGSMFEGCSLLETLPDISKWNIKNVSFFNGMFEGCKDNLNIPKKFKDRL